MSRILVVFATRHGLTRQIAEAVATADGALVDFAPAVSVRGPVTGYDLVVVAARGTADSGELGRAVDRILDHHQGVGRVHAHVRRPAERQRVTDCQRGVALGPPTPFRSGPK